MYYLRYIAMIAALFVVSRCSIVQSIDPAIQPIVDEFLIDAQNHGALVDIKTISAIEFGSVNNILMQNVIGVCMPLIFLGERVNSPLLRSNRVVVTSEYPANSYKFKALIYHELGHCLLGRQHTNDLRSLMYPIISDNESFYRVFWKDLVHELFIGNHILEKGIQ